MSRERSNDQRALILHCSLRAGTPVGALEELSRAGVPISRVDREELLRFFEEESLAAAADQVRSIKATLGNEVAEFCILGKALFAVVDSDSAYVARLATLAGEIVDSDSYCWCILRSIQAEAARRAGELDLARSFLREGEMSVASLDHTLMKNLCEAHLEAARGTVSQSAGDFAQSFKSLKAAERIAISYGLRFAPLVRYLLANLHWVSGLPQAALELHTASEHREIGASAYGAQWLIRSHLSAAKCAIDCDELLIAEQELRAAEQLLRETSDLPEMLQGYYLMYSGEHILKALKGKDPRGFDLLELACQHFESMSPPFHAGLLDAKISITQYAIRTDDHPRMFSILHNILDEATSKGCLDARARALVFESSLFVSDNPPLRAAFDDLVTRLHVINNPALLMQAFANLFTYSLRYLEQPDQAFLMGRLRNLQSVLDESCYQDLYETYIEKRYSWAIENRLAEVLEEEGGAFDDDPSGRREPTQ